MATTTFRRDYLQRKILNPGTTATDYLGRLTTSTVDSLGRGLYGIDYTISTLYTTGQYVQIIATGILYLCTVGGTSAASTPTAPGVGQTVVSGSATFLQLTTG
jgi:hypothetical protein